MPWRPAPEWIIYVQPNSQTGKVFHSASQLPGALSYQLCPKQKSVMSGFWKENVFMFLWWFLAIVPMHGLISLLAVAKSIWELSLLLSFLITLCLKQTLLRYKTLHKLLLGYKWFSRWEEPSMVISCRALFLSRQKVFLFDWEDLIRKLLWNCK